MNTEGLTPTPNPVRRLTTIHINSCEEVYDYARDNFLNGLEKLDVEFKRLPNVRVIDTVFNSGQNGDCWFYHLLLIIEHDVTST